MLRHVVTHTHTHTQCTCRLTCTPEYTNNHISDLLATLHPRTCSYWADLLLTIISRKHGRPCHPALVPISYAHCIISTQQPLIMQVWHINYCWWQWEEERESLSHAGKRKTRSHITPLEAEVNVSQCQGVFVFLSADQDALELLSVTTVLSIYIYVCVWAFIGSHTLWLHTHTGNIKSGGDVRQGLCVSSGKVKSSQVTFIYIAPLTIQIVTKHCTISK